LNGVTIEPTKQPLFGHSRILAGEHFKMTQGKLLTLAPEDRFLHVNRIAPQSYD
jgi:hypothetical protein